MDDKKPKLNLVGMTKKDAKITPEEKMEENCFTYGKGLSEGYASAVEILIKYDYKLRLAGLKCSQAKTQKEIEYSIGFLVGLEQALSQFGTQEDD